VAILSLTELMIKDATISDDPIEKHIVAYLQKLKHQNKRLKDHIQKTGAWAKTKDVELWKPFDFYHYFCTKYCDRYGHEYSHAGSIVIAYQKIDEFRLGNQISKKAYKVFVDRAFERYFNKLNLPRLAHICSLRLYNHVMATNVVSADEYHQLDRDLAKENEKYEEYVRRFNEGEA